MRTYEYECKKCRQKRPYGRGLWSQDYLDKYHNGSLEVFDHRHRELWPVTQGHEVVKLATPVVIHE